MSWQTRKAERFSRAEAEKAARWFARKLRMDANGIRPGGSGEPPVGTAGIEKLWDDLGAMSNEPRVRGWRAEALAATARRHGHGWRTPSAFAAAAAILLLLAGPLIWTVASGWPGGWSGQAKPEQFSTGPAQRAVLTLADGSVVTMGSDSLLQIRWEDQSRHLDLLHGSAYFEVAHDRSRPFTVGAAEATVTALGTVFRVDIDRSVVEVALVEGRVVVEATDAHRGGATSRSRLTMAPGTRLHMDHRGWRLNPANLDRERAWREGKLLFDSEPLSSAVEEINRYSTRQIVLADRVLAARRISGVFDMGETRSFVRGLVALQIASVVQDKPEQIILGP